MNLPHSETELFFDIEVHPMRDTCHPLRRARERFNHDLSHADDRPLADVEHRECVDKGPEALEAFRQLQVSGDAPHFENCFLAGGVTLEIESPTGPRT
jgi:hypothetical protein